MPPRCRCRDPAICVRTVTHCQDGSPQWRPSEATAYAASVQDNACASVLLGAALTLELTLVTVRDASNLKVWYRGNSSLLRSRAKMAEF